MLSIDKYTLFMHERGYTGRTTSIFLKLQNLCKFSHCLFKAPYLSKKNCSFQHNVVKTIQLACLGNTGKLSCVVF